MKTGDRHVITMGKDAPGHAAYLTAMAAVSLTGSVPEDLPIAPDDLEEIARHIWTTVASLESLTERLSHKAVDDRSRTTLTDAHTALAQASAALFLAEHPDHPDTPETP